MYKCNYYLLYMYTMINVFYYNLHIIVARAVELNIITLLLVISETITY